MVDNPAAVAAPNSEGVELRNFAVEVDLLRNMVVEVGSRVADLGQERMTWLRAGRSCCWRLVLFQSITAWKLKDFVNGFRWGGGRGEVRGWPSSRVDLSSYNGLICAFLKGSDHLLSHNGG